MREIIKHIKKLNLSQWFLILALIDIVIFVNFNNLMNKQEFKLSFYLHIFVIVLIFIKNTWKHKNNLTRSFLIALGFYWVFEILMQSIAVVDYDLKKELYKGKTINYILALSCGGSLFVLCVIDVFKKILSSIKKNKKWNS